MKTFDQFLENFTAPSLTDPEFVIAWQTMQSKIRYAAQKISMGQNAPVIMTRLEEEIKSELANLEFYKGNR